MKDYKNYVDGAGNEVQSGFKIKDWTGKIGFNPGENHRVQISLRNMYARDVLFPALPMDEIKDDTRMISLDYGLRNLSGINSANFKVYYSRVYHLMTNEYKPTRMMMEAATEANTRSSGARAEVGLLIERSILYLGFDYSRVEKEGFRTRKMLSGPMAGKTFTDSVWQKSYVNNFGVFVEYRTGIYGFNLIASARYDINYAEPREPAPTFARMFGTLYSKHHNLSASIGIDKVVSSSVQLTLLLGMSKRSPNISERFINFLPIGYDNYDYVGNPTLKGDEQQR